MKNKFLSRLPKNKPETLISELGIIFSNYGVDFLGKPVSTRMTIYNGAKAALLFLTVTQGLNPSDSAELLKNMSPIPQVKETYSGMDSSGKPVSMRRRVYGGVMASLTLFPAAKGLNFLGKRHFAGRGALGIVALTSLKTLGVVSAK